MPLACLSGRSLGYAVSKLIKICIIYIDIVMVIYVKDNTYIPWNVRLTVHKQRV